MRLSQVANNMAVHSVSNLNSMDNVTVLILLLSGGPASCPVRLPSPTKFHARTFSAVLPVSGGASSASRHGDSSAKDEYYSNTRASVSPKAQVEADLDTHLDDDEDGMQPLVSVTFA